MDVILDTSVLIAAERDRSIQIPGEDIALPAIVVLEYKKGVERARSEARRRSRQAFFDQAFGDLPVLPFDESTARVGARIWSDLEAAGCRIPPLDLLIAATAVEHAVGLATSDLRDFSRVDGLDLVEVAVTGGDLPGG